MQFLDKYNAGADPGDERIMRVIFAFVIPWIYRNCVVGILLAKKFLATPALDRL